jgi:hypothetical protein
MNSFTHVKLYNLDEMDKYLKNRKLPKFTQSEID